MSGISNYDDMDISMLYAAVSANAANADTFYLLYAGALVFLMQAGFAMLCAGSVRAKNAKNIMLKNVLDACVGAIGFWSFGYGIAYGNENGGNWFCGDSLFFLVDYEDSNLYEGWFFQFAFAATAATIVSGSVAERCHMGAYVGYSTVLTAWVYPVVVHWIWSGDGWLTAFRDDALLGIGVVDFAGCGVVHMVGGAAALAGAAVLGPRIGRFNEDGTVNDMPGHNSALVVLGTFLLWFGWYGFNPGSTLGISADGYSHVAAKTAVTTTLSAASGAVANLFFQYHLPGSGRHIYDLEATCNGALAGLVGITSACPVVDPWAALVIGAIASLWYQMGARLLIKLRIDDVVNAAPVHLFAGAWGLLAPAFFASATNMGNAYGADPGYYGIFLGGKNCLKMLACQAIALIAILVWTFGHMFPFFFLLKVIGIFRVTEEQEEDGLDVSKHGGSAYAFEGKEGKEEGDKKGFA